MPARLAESRSSPPERDRRSELRHPQGDGATIAIAPAGKSVWVSSFSSNTVTRIDSVGQARQLRTVAFSGDEFTGTAVALPRGGRVVSTLAVPTGGALPPVKGLLDDGQHGVGARAHRPRTNLVVARIRLIGAGEDAAAGEGAVWVSHPGQNTVSRIDPARNTATTSIRVRSQPAGLGVTAGAVWVANIGGPRFPHRPRDDRVVATIRVGPPRARCAEHMNLIVDDDGVWVAVPNFDALVPIDPATNSVATTVRSRTPCVDSWRSRRARCGTRARAAATSWPAWTLAPAG